MRKPLHQATRLDGFFDRIDPEIGRRLDSFVPEGRASFDLDTLTRKDIRCSLREKWAPFAGHTRIARLCGQPAPHALPTLRALKEEHEGFFEQAKTEILEFLKKEDKASAIDLLMLQQFVEHYIDAAHKSQLISPERMKQVTTDLIKFVSRKQEFAFKPYHRAVREPYDFFRLGIDLFRPLVNLETSRIEGESELVQIEKQLERGDNVIFLSNHQVEPDPQITSIIFNSMGFQQLAENVIFLAGHRVRDDPLGAPLSYGCNLICIYSKKHMSDGDKELKQRENLEAMIAMQSLFKKGGQLFWVAPSGGRDRPDSTGEFKVSPFDPKTVSLFNIMAKKSKRPLHFYPMALFTYPIMPPPPDTRKEIGESRSCAFSPVGMAIGREISVADDMSEIAEKYVRRAYDSINPLKKQRRKASL